MSASNSASVRKKPARGRGAGYSALRERADATTKEARQLAMLVLEVLAGAKTPSESADVLGVSLPRYYALETRALAGAKESAAAAIDEVIATAADRVHFTLFS